MPEMNLSSSWKLQERLRSRILKTSAALVLVVSTAKADVTNSGYFAALTEADLDRAISMAVHKDVAALALMQAANRIVALKPGLEVQVIDRAIFSGKVKFRVTGTTLELWAPYEAISSSQTQRSTPTPAPTTLPSETQADALREVEGPIALHDLPDSLRPIIATATNAVSYTVYMHHGRYGVTYRLPQKLREITAAKKQEFQAQCQSIWRQLKDSPEAITGVIFESADGKIVCSY